MSAAHPVDMRHEDGGAMTPQARELRDLRRILKDHTNAVVTFLRGLDAEMKRPDSNDRGRRIAQMANNLAIDNDMARHFGLGIDLADLNDTKMGVK